MKSTDSQITVLMPAYNAEKYIGEAIASVLGQSFTDFELLIINDGSTDGSKEIIGSFTDKRIRLINQTNQGIAAALNIGLLNAKADLVARFDADDICQPERLGLQYEFLKSNPEYIVVGSNVKYIDMHDEFVFNGRMSAYSDEAIRGLILKNCPFIHSSVMFRKGAVLKAGSYNIHAHAFEDHLLWLKLLDYGKACNLPEMLVKVRLAPESISIDEKWRTKRFHEIKSGAIRSGNITEPEGTELLSILKQQNNPTIKEGSYYSLLGKKYLWDNHQPEKARINLKKAISIHPARLDSYAIMLLSFFPKDFISWLYKKKVNKIKI
jgi:glycosyltransferase involved in cell wall biosynthesis